MADSHFVQSFYGVPITIDSQHSEDAQQDLHLYDQRDATYFSGTL